MVPCSTLLINQSSFFISVTTLRFLSDEPNGSSALRLLATACCISKCSMVIYHYHNQL